MLPIWMRGAAAEGAGAIAACPARMPEREWFTGARPGNQPMPGHV